MIQKILRNCISIIPWNLRGIIKHIPVFASLQRWVLSKYLNGHEFVHTVDAGPAQGLRYPITLPVDKGIWTGTYESEMAGAIALAIQPGSICLDIGGWRGFFGGLMALAGADKVYIFEPLPENIKQLKKMIALNPNLNIELVEAAVTDNPGEIEFVMMPETSMGKLTQSSFQSNFQSSSIIKVQGIALDWFFEDKKIPPPSIIKIDVEGAEVLVLKGALRLLSNFSPKIFMEVHSNELSNECQEILIKLGYKIKIYTKRDSEISHLHASK